MKPTAYQIYCEYCALKAHFTNEKYDYFRYNKKANVSSPTVFNGRRDRAFFEKLSRHRDPLKLLIANFAENFSFFIGDFASAEGERIYQNWAKRIEALTYFFKEDLLQLNPDFNLNFIVPKGGHPQLIKLYLANKIGLDTFIILIDLTHCFPTWTKKLSLDDILWTEVSKKYNKYKPFLAYDETKFKQVLLEFFKKPLDNFVKIC